MFDEDLSRIQTKPRESCGCEVELLNISPVDCFMVADHGLNRKMIRLQGTEGKYVVMHRLALYWPNLRHT